jgi:hypothetical protein
VNAGLKYFPTQFHCKNGAASVNESAIRAFVNASPKLKGMTWLAFNEPDKDEQADCTPRQAAQALRKLDEVLRSGSNPADPSAKIYCCGLVDRDLWDNYLSSLRTEYMSLYGQNPPLQGVHLHLYNWSPTRLDWCRLRNGLDEFRSWQQGQSWLAGKPIIVSEWGVLSNLGQYPSDPQAIVGNCAPGCTCDTMAGMFDVFESRSYVQYHMWWTAYNSGFWNSGNVFTSSSGTTLTSPVGLRYRYLSTGH